MQKNSHLVGCCGISCSACGLYVKNKCEGCIKTQEAVDALNKEDIGCAVLECAVAKKVDVCSRDCQDFPCENFKGWPLSQEWLDMYKSRNK